MNIDFSNRKSIAEPRCVARDQRLLLKRNFLGNLFSKGVCFHDELRFIARALIGKQI